MSKRPGHRTSILLTDMDEDLLIDIFARLDAIALSSLACTCRKLRSSAENPAIWQPLAVMRWFKPNKQLAAEDAAYSSQVSPAQLVRGWKKLYVSGNGWHGAEDGTGPPAMLCKQVAGSAHEGPATLLPLPAISSTQDSLSQRLLIADADHLWQLSPSGQPQLEGDARQKLITAEPGSAAMAYVTENLVATGHGSCIGLHSLATSGHTGWPQSMSTVGFRTSVEQLHYDVPSQQLLVLNSGLAYGEAERSNIMAWDLETQVETSKTVEFMEAYALCCFAPMSEAAGPPLYVAGAVYADKVHHGELPSLLGPQVNRARTATVCVLDQRERFSIVQRYSTHHSSMFPRMVTVREHYFCTSHVGEPFTAWDIRFMSMPVHEQQRLGNYSQRGAFDHLPLGAPKRQATHQGLFLDADDDVLVGRAENGMVWMWDLSATLGWARPQGLARGSWHLLRQTQDWSEFRDWPTALGAWPCGFKGPTGTHWSQQICLSSGTPWQLCGPSAIEEGVGRVMCAGLKLPEHGY